MIASRFRSIGWTGSLALAVVGCYLVSQRVSSERAGVEHLDRQIQLAKIDLRKLQTELGTRSRLPVLEQWNDNVLALSAPSASQYLHGEVQLARFETTNEQGASIRQVSTTVEPREDALPRIQTVALTRSSPGEAERTAPAIRREGAAQSMVRPANFVKPAEAGFDPAPGPARKVSLLGPTAISDLQKLAQREKRRAKQPQ